LRPRAAHFPANGKDYVMPFEKGESGNPVGRPRGARNRATLLVQNLLAEEAEAIGRKAVEMAKGGDLAAIRLCMARLAPARKDEPVAFELPPIEKAADGVAAAASIVAAVAGGELTPSQAAGDRRLRAGARQQGLRRAPQQARKRDQVRKRDEAMSSHASARLRPCRHASRRIPPVAENERHCFRIVINNENTYQHV
jgi:hypothetical protein